MTIENKIIISQLKILIKNKQEPIFKIIEPNFSFTTYHADQAIFKLCYSYNIVEFIFYLFFSNLIFTSHCPLSSRSQFDEIQVREI